jgi:hypothetical protein
MYVRGLDTTLSMIDSVIRKTSLDEDGLEGHGMKIHGNAAATLERCLLEDNHSFGITFSAPDTDLYVIASVIRKTRPNAGDLYGFGLLGFHSKVTLSGVLVSENQEVGLQANYEPTEIVISGSIIRNTQTRDHGAAGAGVLAVTGAQITLHQTLVSGNATFGIGADGPGAKMVLSRSTVSDTEHGGLSRVINGQIEEQVFGDGAIATQGGFLMVTESAVLRNGRTGIFVTNSSAELSDSVILDNYSYGLAMKDSEQAVSYKELGNYITGNASGLPANLASDISTDPGGMPVPNEPAMPEFSKWDR